MCHSPHLPQWPSLRSLPSSFWIYHTERGSWGVFEGTERIISEGGAGGTAGILPVLQLRQIWMHTFIGKQVAIIEVNSFRMLYHKDKCMPYVPQVGMFYHNPWCVLNLSLLCMSYCNPLCVSYLCLSHLSLFRCIKRKIHKFLCLTFYRKKF